MSLLTNPKLSYQESSLLAIIQIGIVGRLVLGKVSQAWVLPGRLHPANLTHLPLPRAEKISGCAPTCSRGYCWILPFPMSVPANMHSKDNERDNLFLRATRGGYSTTRCR